VLHSAEQNVGVGKLNYRPAILSKPPKVASLESRNSKIFTLKAHVSKTVARTRYSSRERWVNLPSASRRYLAKRFIACSALLLFHGTPSYSRNVPGAHAARIRPVISLRLDRAPKVPSAARRSALVSHREQPLSQRRWPRNMMICELSGGKSRQGWRLPGRETR
jgi:hypothetical protein